MGGGCDRGVRTPGVSPGPGSWSTWDQLMGRGVRRRGTYTRRLAGVRELVHRGPTDEGGCTTEGFVHQGVSPGSGSWSTGDQLMRRGVRPRGTYTRRLAGARELVHRGPTDEEGCMTEGFVHQASRGGQGAGPQGTN